jgi:hypothetical protein
MNQYRWRIIVIAFLVVPLLLSACGTPESVTGGGEQSTSVAHSDSPTSTTLQPIVVEAAPPTPPPPHGEPSQSVSDKEPTVNSSPQDSGNLPFAVLVKGALVGAQPLSSTIYVASSTQDLTAFAEYLTVEHKQMLSNIDFSNSVVIAVFAKTGEAHNDLIMVQKLVVEPSQLSVVVEPIPDQNVSEMTTASYEVVVVARTALSAPLPTDWVLLDSQGQMLAINTLPQESKPAGEPASVGAPTVIDPRNLPVVTDTIGESTEVPIQYGDPAAVEKAKQNDAPTMEPPDQGNEATDRP